MRNIGKQGLVLVIALVFMAGAAHAQSLTAADRDKAMKYLESTKQGVADATKGLSPAQWNFKPAPDKWSVAEVTEHIAAAEDYLRGMVVEKVMTGPPRPAGEYVAAIDEMVLKMIPDRSHPAQLDPGEFLHQGRGLRQYRRHVGALSPIRCLEYALVPYLHPPQRRR
jgi:hypothetical protein